MTLILILAAIVVTAAIGFALLNLGNEIDHMGGFLCFLFGIITLGGAGLAGVCYAFTIWSWVASDSKANIINREYGTSYTREEVFYASDVIDTIRQLDRKRVEVNGDLFREKAEK